METLKNIIEKTFEVKLEEWKPYKEALQGYRNKNEIGEIYLTDKGDRYQITTHKRDNLIVNRLKIGKENINYEAVEKDLVKIAKEMKKVAKFTFQEVRENYGHFLHDYKIANYDERIDQIEYLMDALESELETYLVETEIDNDGQYNRAIYEAEDNLAELRKLRHKIKLNRNREE